MEVGHGAALHTLRERDPRQERADAGHAALPMQGLRAELHRRAHARQAAGDEGRRRLALYQRPVDEPHRQASGRVHPDCPGLARAVRRGLCPKARARRAGRGHRARRDGALSEKKSQQLWVWKAWDRTSGRLVDWECGDRGKATCERLIERLQRWRTRLYGADDYAVYDVLLPVGSPTTARTKRLASSGDNARQRHWLARFRRRSIVVSQTVRMVDVSIALFARFAGNDSIADLL